MGNESVRQAGQYLVSRAGAQWMLTGSRGRGRVSVTSSQDWKIGFNYAVAGRSGTGQWKVKDGAWVERSTLRGPDDAVVLPALISRGLQWEAAASIERGGTVAARFEVISLDASLELAAAVNGVQSIDHCVVVLETVVGDGLSYTHYFAPHLGKVAVRKPDGWLYRLTEFRAGAMPLPE